MNRHGQVSIAVLIGIALAIVIPDDFKLETIGQVIAYVREHYMPAAEHQDQQAVSTQYSAQA